MPGTMVATGVVGVTGALAVGLCVVAAGAVFSQRLAGAADAAALAAADAASGAIAGVPCERADELARAAGAVIVSCALDDLVATVTVSATFAGMTARASARAGPRPFSQ